mmetsp:Transcript_1276/g.2510  ORF Transcript_1276/g.2510 Transcript_1276/m.2510 type:complete len:204 (+) Transcript_1276:366-977(+)
MTLQNMKSRISKRGFQSTSTPYAEGALQHRSSNLGIWRSSRASPPCQLNAIASFISTSSRSSLLASTTLASPEQTADASSSLSFTSSSMATRRSRAHSTPFSSLSSTSCALLTLTSALPLRGRCSQTPRSSPRSASSSTLLPRLVSTWRRRHSRRLNDVMCCRVSSTMRCRVRACSIGCRGSTTNALPLMQPPSSFPHQQPRT